MEEADKGCSEFRVTVGAVTRTADIPHTDPQLSLAESTIKGMSSHTIDLVVCANPSCSSVDGFFWYR